MRLVFISTGHPVYDTYPSGGGIQYQIYGLARELARLGHEVFIVKRRIHEDCLDDELVNFVNIKASLRDNVVSVLLYSLRARGIVKHLEPDYMYLSERFSAHFIADLPIIKSFKIHNYDALGFYRGFAIEYNKFNIAFFPVKQRIERRVFGLVDAILVANQSYMRYVDSCGFGNLHILPNAVNGSIYYNAGDYGFVLFAGRLNRVKGVRYLIEAFRGMERDFPDFKLYIVGDGPEEHRLKDLSRVSDKIVFIKWLSRDRLIDLISRCSLLVLPSLFESFGNVLLEGMACGKTVIASDVMGPRDLITHGEDGFLFRTGDSRRLRAILTHCLSDPDLRRRVGRQARSTIESKYTFKKAARELIRIYSTLNHLH